MVNEKANGNSIYIVFDWTSAYVAVRELINPRSVDDV